jgi:hypothetical protein
MGPVHATCTAPPHALPRVFLEERRIVGFPVAYLPVHRVGVLVVKWRVARQQLVGEDAQGPGGMVALTPGGFRWVTWNILPVRLSSISGYAAF